MGFKYRFYCSGECERKMKNSLKGQPISIRKKVITDNGVEKLGLNIRIHKDCPDCGYSLYTKVCNVGETHVELN